ncbi:hypothetical protein GL325_07760 [Aeromicrobium sp. 636]|uniref:ABC transporter permease n=1 Tax=Aeromicrobium senzhongii TaxID=2663859 RepID=A0A8I0K2R6_9ACTN|nr:MULTISPECIES: hypothetical protein [Aeromicrobium]MBC9226210.1 hypothetical protein [Aeromicrobium senzhongii]MCQ3998316.1 hypothetical protein [Aeromicrobium sp. 636]
MSAHLTDAVVGTGPLTRLVLRRDRVRLPLWLIGITVLTGVSARAVAALYDTPAERAGYAATVQDSAVSRLFGGVPRGVDTIGGILAFEIGSVASVTVALMAVFLVVRHTRSEEESGRAELVRSTVTGRYAALLSTVVVSLAACVAAAALVAGIMALSGADPGPSVLFGCGVGGVGLVFTSLTAVAVQVAASTRRALGIALAALLAFFLLRGYGALDGTWWTWTSPFGWQDELRPFGDGARWWPLALSLAGTVVALLVAAWLAAHRDFGAGLVAERAGPARARAWLATPWGLALREQRGLMAAWAAGLVVTAAVFGAVGNEVRELVESNAAVASILGGTDDVVLGYLSYVVTFLGVLVSAFAVASALRLRHGEVAGQAQTVLAAGVSRDRWAWSAIAVTVAGVVGVAAVVALTFGVFHALVTGEVDMIPRLWRAVMATVPAMLLLASVVVALHGWLPRWTLLAWAGPMWAFIQAYLGDLLDLPGWIAGLSPFEHLPALPTESFEAGPALVQTAVAVALTVVGVAGLRRRDLS